MWRTFYRKFHRGSAAASSVPGCSGDSHYAECFQHICAKWHTNLCGSRHNHCATWYDGASPLWQPRVFRLIQVRRWDPYSTSTGIPSATPYYAPAQPGAMPPGTVMPNQPPSLFPQGSPYRPNPGYYGFTQQDCSLGQWRRFLTETRLEHTWIYGPSASANMQMHVTELSGTFAVPFLYNSDSPLLITPGFALNLFDGPISPDWPPRTYDGYVDFAWKPHVTPQISGDLGFRVSASSDFRTLNAGAIRYMGRGVGILTFSPTLQIALGVVYLDRQNIKILPAGGVVWTPSPDVRADILFPNPKISKRLRDFGTTEVWGYVAGEYGGGSWNVKRAGHDGNAGRKHELGL